MPQSNVSRDSALPLYHQIANVLRSRIFGGDWSEGERIPAETNLAETFGVSLLTVRQALTLLENEGLLVRRQGAGTFVGEVSQPADRVLLSVPLQEITTAIADLPINVLGIDYTRGPSDVRRLLELAADEQAVQIRRVRLRDDRPMSYAISYLPASLGSDLTPEQVAQPLLIEVIEAAHGIRFTQVHQSIEATIADPTAATVLGTQVGAPLLLVRRTYATASDKVSYVAINRYPSHLFRYEMSLVRQDDDEPRWAMDAPVAAAKKRKPTRAKKKS